MSSEAISWAKRQKTGSSTRKAILLVLADRSDDNDFSFPSIRKIAEWAETSERSASRALADMCKLGLLTKEARFTGAGRQTSNGYYLNLKQSVDPDTVSPPPDTVSPPPDTSAPPEGDTASPPFLTPPNESESAHALEPQGSSSPCAPDTSAPSTATAAPADRPEGSAGQASGHSKPRVADRWDGPIAAALKKELGDAPYRAWITKAVPVAHTADRLILRAESRFARDWLTNNYRAAIARAAGCAVEIVWDDWDKLKQRYAKEIAASYPAEEPADYPGF